jgi:hypothetical protein
VIDGVCDPPETGRLSFLRDYTLLALADHVSLLFCLGEPASVERDGYWIEADGSGRVLIRPDPFGGRVLPLSIGGRRLPVRRFTSDEDLRAAWRAAPAVTVTGKVAGGPPPEYA